MVASQTRKDPRRPRPRVTRSRGRWVSGCLVGVHSECFFGYLREKSSVFAAWGGPEVRVRRNRATAGFDARLGAGCVWA